MKLPKISQLRRRPLPKALPLRIWLVVLIVAVSFLGLVASAVAVNAMMREVVYDQVDKDLKDAAVGWARNETLLGNSYMQHPPSDFTILSYQQDGTWQFFNVDKSNIPKVDDLIIGGRPQSVGATADGQDLPRLPENEWRAIATEDGGSIIVVAKKVTRENAQINGMAGLQVLITACALVLVALVGAAVIRRALRPLRVVEKTAAEIAAGDLDKRVPEWPEHTEVGQLSRALNTMLERLQDSVETAQEKEGQMRRFVGDASHELRTPLTSLRGYTELYRSGATQDVDRVLGKIDAESKRMSLLVEDLLALTRAEGNRLELHTVDMLELCLSAGSTARAAFPGRSIEVTNRAGGIPLVKGDPDRLHQVLLNLVSNGLRHGGEDAKIQIVLRNDAERVFVDVVDDGKGMDPEVSAHIFERFYRADVSRTRDTGGSGLGLSIVKSLVEQHGGTVCVESEPGQGSTFTVALPALKED